MRNDLPHTYLAALLIASLAINSLAFAASDDSNAHNETNQRDFPIDDKIDKKQKVQLGARPFFLVNNMDKSKLKQKLENCAAGPFYKTDFSIGHRGAPLQFPEHTKESYKAAAKMGAGIVECDVTFTKDRELVCRHSQCDLHTTTNILAIPELAAKCSIPFTPADTGRDTPATARCCTSDITLAEFKTLQGKMDAANTTATTVEEYMNFTPKKRAGLYSSKGTLMTHAESITLFKKLGVKYIPELKSPDVTMPYEGEYTQQAYAQQMINEYKTADIDPKNVWPQSFNMDDVRYWIENEPSFGKQAVYLDGRYSDSTFDHRNPVSWSPTMNQLVADGVRVIAPPMWMLLEIDDHGKIIPSDYANAANDAGLGIITWTIERSGPLKNGGGWYYQTINGNNGGNASVINNDGDMMEVLHTLAKDVRIQGIFSDWPATVTYYANCMGLK